MLLCNNSLNKPTLNCLATVVASCPQTQCENHGLCHERTCVCLPGYFGARCELFAAPCLTLLCNFRGVCARHPATGLLACACDRGFAGASCERPLPLVAADPSLATLRLAVAACRRSPCRNGGKCELTDYRLGRSVCAVVYLLISGLLLLMFNNLFRI
jgi:hypothetical protein